MFKLLTVVEDHGQSDRISALHNGYDQHGPLDLYISITNKQELIIKNFAGTLTTGNISAPDIDSLIEYLQDAKTFLAEEATMKKLVGENMAVNRNRKMINVEQESAEFEYETLAQVLERVQYFIKVYGEDATFQNYTPLYSESTYMYIYKDIPETDDEMNARIKQEERWEEQRIRQARETYETLKKQFGDK